MRKGRCSDGGKRSVANYYQAMAGQSQHTVPRYEPLSVYISALQVKLCGEHLGDSGAGIELQF